ncbi:MAG: hypothetical protein AAF741_09625 [Bacteroidota bacterium]
MDKGILTEAQGKDPELIKKMVEKIVERKGFDQIKANADGFDTPAPIRKKDKEGNVEYTYIPDVTGTINGRKSYFELGMKTEGNDDTQKLVSKWRLLSDFAAIKNGKLYLAVPRGHMAFTNRILADYPIKAEVVKI